jgi:hypothetical protein
MIGAALFLVEADMDRPAGRRAGVKMQELAGYAAV